MDNAYIHKNVTIGTIGTSRIKLQLEIRKHVAATHKRTIDMQKAPKEYHELSICGDIRESCGGGSGGQNCDSIRDLIKVSGNMELKGEGTLGDLLEILDIWDRWHLNDMHAGTRKQEAAIEAWKAEGNKYDYTEAKVALVRKGLDNDLGYSYGSAWLLEVLPPETEARVVALFAKFEA